MLNLLTLRQPLLFLSFVGLSTASLLSMSNLKMERANAETQLAVGDKITTLKEVANLPDGPYQLCSEPEPDQYLGSGICYWFTKTGQQFIGYYGIPHSDIFIDCVSGIIQAEKIVGEAIAISWEGAPFPNMGINKPLTWKSLTLGPGNVEYQSKSERGELALIKFNQAELTLRDFYRYSPAKAKQMNPFPSSCSVQDWVKQIANL